MPASEALLKSLAGNTTAVDQTLGCMMGLFHIFEGHPGFMGRRSSSTRVGNDSGQSQLRTKTDSQPHHHERQNPFSKVEDRHKETVQSTKQHHRSYSDVSDLAMTPSRTLTEFRTARNGNGSDLQIESAPAYSEGTVDALAFYNNESLRAAAIFAGDPRRRSDLDQRECIIKRSVVSPKTIPKARFVNKDTSSSDIRDALLSSFQRESERPKSSKASSDQLYLTSSRNQLGSLKNRRDRCQDRQGAVAREAADLPRSSSVYARYEPRELVQWKDGLRSSASPPRKISHHSSPERRVEPKKDRGRSLSRDYAFASPSPKRFPGSQGPKPRDAGHDEIHNKDCIFKESPGASDFRESLGSFLTGAQEHGTAPARESFASRSADSSGFSIESNRVGDSHQMCKHLPEGEAASNEHCVVPNVIARLMGLEEIPSSNQHGISSSKVSDTKSRGDKFFPGLMQFDPQITRSTSPPPPPPCQTKQYVVHHLEQPSAYYGKEDRLQGAYQDNYLAQYKMEQGLCSCEEDRDYEHFINSRPFLPFNDEHQEGGHPASGQLASNKEGSPPKLGEPTTQAEDTNVAPEKKKKILRKILEAMRPKVLLKISRRKQTEQEKSPTLKLITNDVQPVQELLEKQRQTTLMKVDTGLKFSGTGNEEAPPTYTSCISQVEVQQTCRGNSTESSIVVMKPVAILSNTSSQVSNADISPARQVETSSSTSNDKEMCPSRRTAQINSDDGNLAKDQRRTMKPVKSRVAADNAPRSAHAESTLESDYETDPSSTTQNDRSNNVRESRKTRTITRKRNPSSKSPTPDTQRKHGLCSSPEARPPLSRSSSNKDHFRGTGEEGRKSVVAKGKKDSRAAPANPKAQLAKKETLERRVTENPDNSRLRGRSLENEPALTNIENNIAKEIIPVRSAGARARSPAAAPRKLDVSHSSTTDAVTLDMSDGSNSTLLQPASAQPQSTASEPILEHPVMAQPTPGRFKESHVYIRRTTSDVQSTDGHSVGDHCRDTSEPEDLVACSDIPDEAQPLLQVQEAAFEASEELTTPRGIPLQHVKLDGELAEGLDRPSPISVLDTTTFDEELTPSPSSLRHSIVPIQDSVTAYNDEGYEDCAKDLEAYHELPAVIEDDLDFDELFSKCAEGLRAQVESTETKIRLNRFQSYFKDAEPDEERTLVESFLLAPEGVTSCRSHDNSVNNSCASDKFKTKPSRFELTDTENINGNLLQSLQSNGILQENDHILLLDCLEEIMERILESQSNLMLWAGLPPETICEKSKGTQLEQELWVELQYIKRTPPSEDICDTIHRLLQRDLIKCQGRQWANFNKDREKIGIDMETMIVGDLIEEAVTDLCAMQWHKPSLPIEATRRQLFAN